jgi:phosphoribosylglycinamide formyltransferase 1
LVGAVKFNTIIEMRIGILISGRGSNMVAIADAVKSGRVPNSTVAVVVSDQPGAEGLAKANDRGIETIVVDKQGRKRAEHDAEICVELHKRDVDLVCLAGYMRLLSPDFIRAFPDRILNIHPSLLPSFKGLEAQKQAIEYGVKISGCTVHFVDEALDHGAIILQKAVEVKDDDTADSLSARILEQEHRLYVEAIAKVAAGAYRIDMRRVVLT